MIISLKNVAAVFVAIRNIETEKGCSKWVYAIAKNKAKMQPDVSGIAAAEKGIQEAHQKRVAFCKKHALKDEKGGFIIKDNQYLGIDENAPELKEIVDNIAKLQTAYDELLKTEVEIDFHKIDFENIPEKISPADFESLSVFINEPK